MCMDLLMSVLYAHIQLIKFSECIDLHFSNDLCTVIQGHSVGPFIEHPSILKYAKIKHQYCLSFGYKLPCNYVYQSRSRISILLHMSEAQPVLLTKIVIYTCLITHLKL